MTKTTDITSTNYMKILNSVVEIQNIPKNQTLVATNQAKQAGYHEKWLKNPEEWEPTAEDIKCELQLQALSAVEPLKWEIDLGWFKKQIKEYDDT